MIICFDLIRASLLVKRETNAEVFSNFSHLFHFRQNSMVESKIIPLFRFPYPIFPKNMFFWE